MRALQPCCAVPNLADSLEVASFPEILEARARVHGDRTAIFFASDGGGADVKLSYEELARRARSIADLLSRAADPGERALLIFPPGVEFVISLFACLYAGIVAVPVYPPRNAKGLPRLHRIAASADVSLALTTTAFLPEVEKMFAATPNPPRCLATDVKVELNGGVGRALWRAPDSLAFLQYTSGSTGEPKGVMLSHANLVHNSAGIYTKFGCTKDSVAVIWLPPYHDMGLIGGILQPIFGGFPVVLLSPLEVLQRPLLWLESLSKYRGTISGGPNFAYELCVRKIPAEHRADLDLSSWAVAFSGAEPVRPGTLRRFADAFVGSGFRESAFYPCYGLAEATLLATGGHKDHPVSLASIDSRSYVACGTPPPSHEVVVVDPDTRRAVPPGTIGEVWLRGPSVAQGYWQEPEATQKTFRAQLEPPLDEQLIDESSAGGPYLRTGDLGTLVDGNLVVTGRRKDLIVLNGRNVYPHDVEAAVDRCHPAIRQGCGVAFTTEGLETERLTIVQEIRPRPGMSGADLADVGAAIRQAVVAELEVLPGRVVLVPPGGVPKTSSGKLRRAETRRLLSEGSLDVLIDSAVGDREEQQPFREEAPPSEGEHPAGWLAGAVGRATGTPVGHADRSRLLTELGVDSLAALRIRHECETRYGTAPDLADLLRYDFTTIAQRLTAARPDVKAGLPAAVGDLSAGESALWVLDRMAAAGYHLARAFSVRGALDRPALRKAFERVVAAYPALRSRFVEIDGVPTRVIDEPPSEWLSEVDASQWDDERVWAACQETADQPFDLSAGRIFRVKLFHRAGECVVVVAAHHIAMDYWSFLLIIDRLRAEYSGEQVPAQRGTYADFVADQGALLRGPEGERLARFWRERLHGANFRLNLPADRSRQAVSAVRTDGRVVREVEPAASKAIDEVARQSSATPYAVILAAWAVVLGAWTGQDDLLIGCPTSGRVSARYADVVGYFVNPVPLRLDISGNPVFTHLVRTAQDAITDALAHQDYPFPELVAQLGSAGARDRNPVFQTMCVHYRDRPSVQNGAALFALGAAGARIDMGELVLENVALAGGGSPVDLTLAVADDGERMVLMLEHADLFTPDSMNALADRLIHLLAGLARGADRTIARLAGPGDRERARVLATASTPAGPLPAECVHRWIEETATAAPDAVAIEHADGRLTYAELNRLANRMAHRLRARGITCEQRVGIVADRSPETIVAILAVLKAGGAYVPLDPAYPEARLRTMKEQARVALLLGPGGLEIPPLCEPGGAELDDNPVSSTTAGSAAYIIFTSGSTGQPKGVLVEHRGVVNLIRAQAAAFQLSRQSTVLQYASLSFDASVSEIFVTLAVGGTLRLADSLSLVPGQGLVRLLADGVTAVTLPPSVLAQLPAHELPGLATVISAGEACTADVVSRWASRRLFLNAYGPTETTVCATVHETAEDEPVASRIGRAMTGVSVYVLDPELDPVSPGNVGEVYIGGLGVARGYVNAPGHTAVRFVPDPFAAHSGARMYRTGDRARLGHDGVLEFLGRVDDQLKLRGYRVEPGDIEAVLLEHSAVRQAAVVLRPLAGHLALAAFVAVQGENPTQSELREMARSRLPAYLVPAVFVLLPELPRGPGGKLDPQALVVPDQNRDTIPYVPPGNRQQQLVAEVWQEILGMEVGVDDNFFDLGGNSFNAARVHSLLEERLGLSFGLIELFEFTTVRALSQRLHHIVPGQEAIDVNAPSDRARRRAQALARRRPNQGSDQ